MALIGRTGIVLAIVAAFAAPANDQHEAAEPAGGPFSQVPVLNAPFSAQAITTVRETPTGRVYTVNARYFRNSQGQVRAELDTPSGPYVVLEVEIPKPDYRGLFYTLDPVKRTYRVSGHQIAADLFNAEGRVAVPFGRVCFERSPAVAGESGDERLRTVNAQLSPDLDIVIASHRSEEQLIVDYELTRIRREEPQAKLFEVPTDYTFVSVGSREDPLIIYAPWQSPRACNPLLH
jgi:hypothetical protein